jgi:hypothetical protein
MMTTVSTTRAISLAKNDDDDDDDDDDDNEEDNDERGRNEYDEAIGNGGGKFNTGVTAFAAAVAYTESKATSTASLR